MKRKHFGLRVLLPSTVIAALLVVFTAASDHNFKVAQNISIFNSVLKNVDLFYVDTIDVDKTVSTGINAMLNSLDPYTTYFPAEDDGQLQQLLKNAYGGIGSVITYSSKTKQTMIAEPYEGMPAQEAGLKAGDVLVKIDSIWLKGKTSSDVSKLLRGPSGTGFTLHIQRPGKTDTVAIPIVRRNIALPTVPYYGMRADSIGYIQLSTFTGEPAKAFRKALMSLKDEGMKGLVIDLRNNGGGLVDQAVDIANYFIPADEVIASTKGRDKRMNNSYKTTKRPIVPELPVAVLVNSGSASASEILSGAFQDLDRGVVIGTRTFGKGLVQSTRRLPYGGTLKVTTAKYYTPSGRCVQAIDYSHRNEDGSVGRIPDSLTHVFHTRIGREVRDGGGITPDIKREAPRMPNILYYMVRDQIFFNFATAYCQIHDDIADAKDFVIDDETYKAFKDSVISADFTYDAQSKKILKQLKEAAEFEGYAKGAGPELKALEAKLKHDIKKDLDIFATPIKKMLAIEIVKRYQYQKGGIIETLKNDSILMRAEDILKNPVEYKAILSKKVKDEAK